MPAQDFKFFTSKPRSSRLFVSASTQLSRGLAALALLVLVGCNPHCASRSGRLVQRPILIVNSEPISTRVLSERLAQTLRNRDPLSVKDPKNLERSKREVTNNLIVETLTRQWAEKNQVQVTAEELERRITSIRAEYRDEISFRRMLAEENLAFDVWRESLRRSLLEKKVFDTLTAQVPEANEAELKALYQANKDHFDRPPRVRLRQILLEREEDAQRVQEELSRGKKLEDLARQFSTAPEASQGGDTGWIEKGSLDVFDVAFKMGVGQRSKILKSPFGWHIYEVLGKEGERELKFDQVREQLLREHREAAAQRLYRSWLEEQIRMASVKVDESILSSIVISTHSDE
jgi:parvulin-like peptidyl-prolyl isomerase